MTLTINTAKQFVQTDFAQKTICVCALTFVAQQIISALSTTTFCALGLSLGVAFFTFKGNGSQAVLANPESKKKDEQSIETPAAHRVDPAAHIILGQLRARRVMLETELNQVDTKIKELSKAIAGGTADQAFIKGLMPNNHPASVSVPTAPRRVQAPVPELSKLDVLARQFEQLFAENYELFLASGHELAILEEDTFNELGITSQQERQAVFSRLDSGIQNLLRSTESNMNFPASTARRTRVLR